MNQQRPAYSIAQFADAFGVCRTTVYEEINSGRLASYQLGRRRFISARAAEEWQRRLEAEAATKEGLDGFLSNPIIC